MKKHINGRGKNKPVTFCIGLLYKAKSFNQANNISLAVNHQTGLTVQLTIPLRCLNENSLESWSKSSLPSFSHYGRIFNAVFWANTASLEWMENGKVFVCFCDKKLQSAEIWNKTKVAFGITIMCCVCDHLQKCCLWENWIEMVVNIWTRTGKDK